MLTIIHNKTQKSLDNKTQNLSVNRMGRKLAQSRKCYLLKKKIYTIIVVGMIMLTEIPI